MINLNVLYKSQWDNDAGLTRNDCGPTSIAMVLNYYGENLTTNDVFKATGAGTGLINFQQLFKAITSFGYKYTYQAAVSLDTIRTILREGKPVIALVHYGSFNSTQDKVFKGGHFFLIVGYRDDGFFVNDPNFQGDYRSHGDHHFYTNEEMQDGLEECYLDGNKQGQIIVIEPKEVENMTDQYKGLDLNNKESMKVAVDIWYEVMKEGKWLKKDEIINSYVSRDEYNSKLNDIANKDKEIKDLNNEIKKLKELKPETSTCQCSCNCDKVVEAINKFNESGLKVRFF